MSPPTVLPASCYRVAGFTLMESLFCLAIIGTLMGMALPQLELQWQKTRRQDAQNSLMQLHLRQLQWRALHPQYASSLTELNWQGSYSFSKHYVLSLQGSNAQGYTLLATAVGLQSRYTPCGTMRLQGFQGIDGTGRLKPASRAQPGAQEKTVAPHQGDQELLKHGAQRESGSPPG